MERRRGQRVRRRFACELSVAGRVERGAVVDLSPDGLFVELAGIEPPAPGTEVEIKLLDASEPPPMVLQGIVARRRLLSRILEKLVRGGFGLRILQAPDAYYRLLEGSGSFSAPSRAGPGAAEVVRESVPDQTDSEFPKPSSTAMLVDRGELDDVYEMLQELGAQPVRLGVDAQRGYVNWDEPPRVFVAAARSALSMRLPPHAKEDGVVTVAIAETDSQTLSTMLRRLEYQYLVRRPVHPEALRLLLARALYRSSDHRQEPRVSVGHEVSWWLDWKRHHGVLVEISPRGCRLLAARTVACNTRLRLRIPRRATGSWALSIRGRIVRCQPYRGAGQRESVSLGVEFEDLSVRLRSRLAALLAKRSQGPARLSVAPRPPAEPALAEAPESLSTPADPPGPGATEPESVADGSGERRQHLRGALHREVVALDEDEQRALLVLVGRDLSPGGIRVVPHPLVSLGDELTLALYDVSSPDPLVVRGVVVRDDGKRGLVLQFRDVKESVAEKIENIIATLPAIQSGASEDRGGDGIFIARIVTTRESAAAGGEVE